MIRSLRSTVLLLTLVASGAMEPAYLSSEAICAGPVGTLYVAATTARQVLRVAAGQVRPVLDCTQDLSGLALSPDGTLLAVTTFGPEGRVRLLTTADHHQVWERAGLHTPTAPVFSPDGRQLWVAERFRNQVHHLDLADGASQQTIAVEREPVACAFTPDGARLIVTNLLPIGRADGDFIASAVSLIEVASAAVTSVSLPNGATAPYGLCVEPAGGFAYVTHVLGRYQVPTTQIERGWINTNALSIIDLATGERLNTVLLDTIDRGAANPWGVACSADGAHLVVAHAGSHELSLIDRRGLHEKLAAAGNDDQDAAAGYGGVPNDLSFLVDLRQRVRLPQSLRGPRGVVISGERAFATCYFSPAVAVLDLATAQLAEPIVLGSEPAMDQVRLGEFFFHDAERCFQQWQSCVSCHPGARSDGLNWDLLNDGLGSPRSSKSMLLAHATPPAMITGIRADAETAVRAGMRYIQFVVRPPEEAAAIDAYLRALQPVASPHLVDGALSPAAQRGAQLFAQNCASCHSGELFTDQEGHKLGSDHSAYPADTDRAFDTPTLIEVWRTAPYLHDGRAATLREAMIAHEGYDLSDAEAADLAAYVLSL